MNSLRNPIALAITAALLAACGDDAEERVPRNAPPAAAVVAPGEESAQLSEQLEALARELERAQAGEPERLLPAEAITDRLLHAERPVDWLATGYDVEARLRQLQALADRVVARLRRGARLTEVGDDLETLQAAVADLQQRLSEPGGGPAPAPLDSLLAQDPLRDVNAPSMAGMADTDGETDDADTPAEPEIEPVGGVLGDPLGTAVDTLPGGGP